MKGLLKFIKNSFQKQLTFTILAGLMVLLILGFVIYVSAFLASNLNKSLSVPGKTPVVQKFDIEGFEKLNLVK